MSNRANASDDLHRFYVYVLIDPRTGTVFYVGKGTGDRCRDHLWKSHNEGVARRVKQLKARGLRPTITLLVDQVTEEAALEREREEIGARKGLCNVQPGALSWQDRHRRHIRAQIASMPMARDVPAQWRTLHKQVLKNLARRLTGRLVQVVSQAHNEHYGEVSVYLVPPHSHLMDGATR